MNDCLALMSCKRTSDSVAGSQFTTRQLQLQPLMNRHVNNSYANGQQKFATNQNLLVFCMNTKECQYSVRGLSCARLMCVLREWLAEVRHKPKFVGLLHEHKGMLVFSTVVCHVLASCACKLVKLRNHIRTVHKQFGLQVYGCYNVTLHVCTDLNKF